MTISFVKTVKQQRLYTMIGELADRFSDRASQFDETGEFPFVNLEELKKSGYTSLPVSNEYGGNEELSLYEFVLLQERIGKGDGPTALSIGWHLGMVMDLFENKRWSDDKLSFIAGEIMKGALLNRAATEPQTGSPTRGGKPQTNAKKVNHKWIVNGRKTFTTMAPILDYFIVTATIEHTEEIGEFLIHRSTPGVRIENTWNTISMRGTGSHDLILEQVELEEDALVEIPSQDTRRKPSGWLLHIPACYIGIALAARDYAVRFAHEYSPNSVNGPIRTLPNVRRLIGEMEAELIQARHVLYSVAKEWDRLDDRTQLGPELGVAKYVVTNTAISVVDKAMRVVGAQSLQKTNPLQRFYRDVRSGLHNPPMDDMTLNKLAEAAFLEIDNENTN